MTETQQYVGAKISTGPQSWQILQREADNCAPLHLTGCWSWHVPGTVEVRVADEATNAPVRGCDWQDAEMLAEQQWHIILRVPTGGLYRVEARLRIDGESWRSFGDRIWHIAVGDLWIIAGQSNAVGIGYGVVNDPPTPGVSLFGVNEVWRMATHPLFDSTDSKYPASRDMGWVGVSPWLAFARMIWQQTGVPIGLIPTALGGSPLAAWDPGNAPEEAYLYHNMLAMVQAAGGRVAGMLWYQGCSDANEQCASTYLMRFTRFVQAVRAQYGEKLPIITAQLNRFLDSSAEQQRPWSQIYEAQRQAARVIPGVAVVPTLDAPLSDAIHNSAAGCVMIGERFGHTALGMVYGEFTPWRAVDVLRAHFAPEALEETTTGKQEIQIHFANVTEPLFFLSMAPTDFMVEDTLGCVPIISTRMLGKDTVILELARHTRGATMLHNAFGCNPTTTLRDHRLRPVLACYGVTVEGEM